MKLFVCYVDARGLDAIVFDPEIHSRGREVDDGFLFSQTSVEGQTDEVQIERRQFGWSELTKQIRSGVLVSWSATGDPAEAVLIARGRLQVPDGLFSGTQTVSCTCAPASIRTRLLAFARDRLDRKPICDFRFSDADPDDPESYLLGYSGAYRVDPATWAISLIDDLVGERVVDLTDHVLGDPEDGAGSFGLPVSTIRARFEVSWTVEAKGICDLATYPGLANGITSYDPDFGQRISSNCLTNSDAEGWTIADAVWRRELLPSLAASPITSQSYRYRVKGKHEVYERKADALLDPNTGEMRYTWSWAEKKKTESDQQRRDREASGAPAPDNDEEEAEQALGPEHQVGVLFQRYAYYVTQLNAAFEFSQDRREIMHASLEVPFVAGLVVDQEETTDDDGEILEFTVDDVFADATAPTYVPGYWKKDDVVRRGEARYRCLEDHESISFTMVKSGTRATYWEPIEAENALDRSSLATLIDTDLGQTYREHVWRRMRKAARRNLRARNLTFRVPWVDGIGVTTADSCRISVPWDDETDRYATGKVVSIRRTWSGEEGPTIEIEIGVSFGATQDPVDTDDSESVWIRNGDVPVVYGLQANRLRSAFYSSSGMLILNDADEQRVRMGEIASRGGDPAQAPVRYPTRLGFTLKPLEAQEEIVREVDYYGTLVVTPAGLDFGA